MRGWERDRSLAALAVISVVVGGGACAHDSLQTYDAAYEAVVNAPARATEEGSVRVVASGRLDFSGEPATLQVVGAADTVSGDAVYATTLETAEFTDAYETRLVDGVAYTELLPAPADPTLQNQGIQWVKFESPEAVSGSIHGGSPTVALASLRGAHDVSSLGIERVNGVITEHYEGEIGVFEARRLTRLDPDRAPDRQWKIVDAGLDLLGASPVPVEVWIDERGLVRRQRMKFVGLPGLTGSITMTMDYFDYGKPVAVVVAPPEEETFGVDVGGAFPPSDLASRSYD